MEARNISFGPIDPSPSSQKVQVVLILPADAKVEETVTSTPSDVDLEISIKIKDISSTGRNVVEDIEVATTFTSGDIRLSLIESGATKPFSSVVFKKVKPMYIGTTIAKT